MLHQHFGTCCLSCMFRNLTRFLFTHLRLFLVAMDDSATISTEKHSQIQSGQFMVSKLDDSDSEQECKSPDNPIEAPQVDRASGVPAFDNLQSLFNRLRLAHYENLTSPRWSHFKGAGFALENKVRLNNIIWREYHMQCMLFFFKNLNHIFRRETIVACHCQILYACSGY